MNDGWLERDSRLVWHPYTPVPHHGPRALLTRAEGAYVYDKDGRALFDATSSWWCNIHGHCHPRLVEALHRQASQLDQVLFSPHSHPVAIELADRLVEKLGKPFAKVFYSDDGSTAVEAALKMALQYWQLAGEARRTKFVSLQNAYHGDTLGAVSVSHVSTFHHFFSDLKAPTFSLASPYPENLRRLFKEHGGEIAALILEPLVLGAGGMVMYSPETLEELVAEAKRHGILVIFDEVFTGFGRTGTFFAMEQISSRPDIVCLSKGLTSGMLPLAATVASDEIFARFVGGDERTFYHGHTFTANALGCAVAVESLKLFDEGNVIEKNRMFRPLFEREAEKFRALRYVKDVRTIGMIWVAELHADSNRPGWSIASRLWDEGVWVRPLGNLLYLVPPFCSTESDLQAAFRLLYTEVQNERHFPPQTRN